MSRIPIPQDWTEETDGYVCVFLCVPNSLSWRSIARGAIHGLTRGRAWDENTGIITDVQQVALNIYGSLCMANCQDIVDALNGIKTALEDGGQTSVDLAAILAQLQTMDTHLDQIEEIQNNQTVVMGGIPVTVLPGGE